MLGNEIDFNEVQSLNVSVPIIWIVLLIVIVANKLHPEKADPSIDVTELGIIIDVNFVQPEKADPLIVFNCSRICLILFTFFHKCYQVIHSL